MSDRILVTGASGVIGRRVAARLAAEGRPMRRATRRPYGPDDVRFDLTDHTTFQGALDTIGTVMLISRPGDEDAHRFAEPFVETMVGAGVHRVVVLSALGAGQRPEFSLRRVERLVEASGLAWTHVRPNFFMQMLAQPPLSTEIATLGLLRLPVGDARVAYVDADDVAAVVFRALIDPSLGGQAIEVSGPEALDHAGLAAHMADLLGRPIHYRSIDDSVARELLRQRGFADRHAERVMTFYRLIRKGFCAQPDSAVAALLGRPLRRWAQFSQTHAAAWSPGSSSGRVEAGGPAGSLEMAG